MSNKRTLFVRRGNVAYCMRLTPSLPFLKLEAGLYDDYESSLPENSFLLMMHLPPT